MEALIEKLLNGLVKVLPIVFAFGFVAPVIAQSMEAANVPAPFGLSSLTVGLIIGGAWGLFAQIKGRWI